jgi:hypothetical protein
MSANVPPPKAKSPFNDHTGLDQSQGFWIALLADRLANYRVQLNPVERGSHYIEKFTVSLDNADPLAMVELFKSQLSGRPVVPGDYTRLVRKESDGTKTTVMSDSPAEIWDHMPFLVRAKGSILITGLGIGMCLDAVCRNPKVQHVTVIERSEDVIGMVWPQLKKRRHIKKKARLIPGDALEISECHYKDCHYDFAWHDIWDCIGADNLPQMRAMKKKYANLSDWQGCWCELECEFMHRIQFVTANIAQDVAKERGDDIRNSDIGNTIQMVLGNEQ